MTKLRDRPVMHGRDHAPGGADPIPGASGGINFDTYPQAGEWLYVETTGAGTSPSGFGMEFFDSGNQGISLSCDSGNGITIDQFGDPDAGVIINNGQGRFDSDGIALGSDDVGISGKRIQIHSNVVAGEYVKLKATNTETSLIVANDETITLNLMVGSGAGGTFVLSQSGATAGLLLEMKDEAGTTILRVDSGHPGFPFAPEYHIKTGASWVADL